MAVSRALHITFYILYLITLALALWFLLHYSGVPSWVWIFFGVSILIAIICTLMKEFLLTRSVTRSGKDVSGGSHGFWLIFYIIMNITAFILIIIGLVFVIKYSTIPWWVWVILGIAILFSILQNVIYAFVPGAGIIGLLFGIVALVLFITGIILIIIYSHSPWWVWLIIGLAVLFAIMAAIFEGMSERNEVIVAETCGKDDPNCPAKITTANTATTTTVTTQPGTVNINLLPSSTIPEQTI